MRSISSLCTFLVFGFMFSLSVLAACPKNFYIQADRTNGQAPKYIAGQQYCRRPGTASCSVAHWADSTVNDPIYISNGGLYVLGANPPRRAYINIYGDEDGQKYVYWLNVTAVPADFDEGNYGEQWRPLTVELEPRSCILRVEFEDFVFHAGTTGGFRRVEWIMANSPVPQTDKQFPFTRFKAIAGPAGGE